MKVALIALISTVLSINSLWADTPLTLPNINSLPELGSPANTSLSTKQEIDFGRQLYRELRQSERFIEDPELVEWINQFGQKLVQHASGRFSSFYFGISQDTSVNAYAMPGGVIVVHAGLIMRVKDENELAAVLAHEIAHVTQRHIARQLYSAKANPWVTGIGLLAGAAAASKSSDAAQAIIAGTIATNMHKQLSYSRAHETEADRIGLRILTGAGYDPNAMADFLEQLDRGQSSLYGDITKYLSTHPLGIERLGDIRSSIGSMKRRPSTNNNGFKLIQTKVGQLIQQDHSGIDPLLKSYYQTLTALRYNQAPQALTYSQKLPNLPQTQVTQAQVLNANQRYAETTKRFMGYIRGGSTSPLLIPVAQALVAQNQSTRAWQLINSARLAETTSLELLDYKQQLAKQLGYSSEALLASAERALRLGNYAQAKMSLEQGLRSNPAPATRPVLTQRLADIKQAEIIKKQLDKF